MVRADALQHPAGDVVAQAEIRSGPALGPERREVPHPAVDLVRRSPGAAGQGRGEIEVPRRAEAVGVDGHEHAVAGEAEIRHLRVGAAVFHDGAEARGPRVGGAADAVVERFRRAVGQRRRFGRGRGVAGRHRHPPELAADRLGGGEGRDGLGPIGVVRPIPAPCAGVTRRQAGADEHRDDDRPRRAGRHGRGPGRTPFEVSDGIAVGRAKRIPS